MGARRIGLIGDRDDTIPAHRAIPVALRLVAEQLGQPIAFDWLASDALPSDEALAAFDGLWCVPGSPYRDMDAVLHAIRLARERGVPFLGTCGGFQHALIDFARQVAGIGGADHAESNATAADLVVTRMTCPLIEEGADITFVPPSQLHGIFRGEPTRETYHCSFGPNPVYRDRLEAAGLRFTGFDAEGQIRAMELPAHPFFIGTLFQPERSALTGRRHPLIEAFVSSLA